MNQFLHAENNYSYKLIEIKNKQQAFYKSDNSEWTEIKPSIFTDKLVLLIPNFRYLVVLDKGFLLANIVFV